MNLSKTNERKDGVNEATKPQYHAQCIPLGRESGTTRNQGTQKRETSKYK